MAYDGDAWDDGPALVYERLATAVLAAAGVSLAGALVADLGAGSGAVSRAVGAGGGRAVALDVTSSMVARARAHAMPVVADVLSLPLRNASVDAACAAFVLSHVGEPDAVLREARRVVRDGGAVVAASFARADDHPTKSIVDEVATRHGWRAPAWYAGFKQCGEPRAADADAVSRMAIDAGLEEVTTSILEVEVGVLSATQLAGWRLGMAQLAPFVRSLDMRTRARLVEEARDAVAPVADQPLRSVLMVLASRTPASRATVSA